MQAFSQVSRRRRYCLPSVPFHKYGDVCDERDGVEFAKRRPRDVSDIVEEERQRNRCCPAATLRADGGCGRSLCLSSSPMSLHRLLLTGFMHRFLSRSDESADLARRATEAPANVLYGTLRRPTERNAARADDFVAAVENFCIIPATSLISPRKHHQQTSSYIWNETLREGLLVSESLYTQSAAQSPCSGGNPDGTQADFPNVR